MPEDDRYLPGSDNARPLPELPAPPAPDPANEPDPTPIKLADLEVETAKQLLRRPIRLATSVLGEVNPGEAEMLAGRTIDRLVARFETGWEEGISIAELAEAAGTDRGKLGKRFNAQLRPFADLVVRGIYAQAGRRVFYEELSSHLSKTGRRHNGVGTDKVPHGPNSLHMLAYSLGAGDRHCPAASEVLATGTRWDRSSPRFGEGLPRWAHAYRGSLPGSFAEHFRRILEVDRSVRAKLFERIEKGGGAFGGELTAERMAAAFSRFLLVPPIPFGRPESPARLHLGIFHPGRDQATVEQAQAYKRHAALACGEATGEERLEFEARSEEIRVTRLPWAHPLEIPKHRSAGYRWSPDRHELSREDHSRGSALQIWRLVGYDKADSFWKMLALVERWSEVHWTGDCTRRWEDDCRPGLQKAHTPESSAEVRALLAMANAAIVAALRG